MDKAVLVLNAGSSSLKFSLFDNHKKRLFRGHVDGMGSERCFLELNVKGKVIREKFVAEDYVHATLKAIHSIRQYGFLRKYTITAIGHRVVHGGEKFWKTTRITKRVLEDIKNLSTLAPLHNPPAIAGILTMKRLFPKVPQYAVFDTAFHHSIPKEAFLYGIPIDMYRRFGIRKYGFHGISHEYVAKEAKKLLQKADYEDDEIITCHLGNGSSITAIKNGRSIDTSMGFTPLDGIIMGTRSGDIDPEVILYLLQEQKYTIDELQHILHYESGLKGIAGISDVRELHKRALEKDNMAQLALDMLAYRVAKYIGSYAASLHGLDAIVFTGGIGENAYYVRRKACSYLKFLGLKIDAHKNRKNDIIISSPDSKVKVFVIPTDEETAIAEKIL